MPFSRMSHVAILRAVKQRHEMKRTGQMPRFQYLKQPRPLLQPVCKKYARPSTSAVGARRQQHHRGCHAECFCCSTVGLLKLESDEEFPPWSTQLGIDNMVHEKRCHSRLNHRHQYTGFYRRRLDSQTMDKDFYSFGLPKRAYDCNGSEIRTLSTSFRLSSQWSSTLRQSSTMPSLRY